MACGDTQLSPNASLFDVTAAFPRVVRNAGSLRMHREAFEPDLQARFVPVMIWEAKPHLLQTPPKEEKLVRWGVVSWASL